MYDEFKVNVFGEWEEFKLNELPNEIGPITWTAINGSKTTEEVKNMSGLSFKEIESLMIKTFVDQDIGGNSNTIYFPNDQYLIGEMISSTALNKQFILGSGGDSGNVCSSSNNAINNSSGSVQQSASANSQNTIYSNGSGQPNPTGQQHKNTGGVPGSGGGFNQNSYLPKGYAIGPYGSMVWVGNEDGSEELVQVETKKEDNPVVDIMDVTRAFCGK